MSTIRKTAIPHVYNCHRAGGDYGWSANNLSAAPGTPKPDEITAVWTFDRE